MQLNELNFRDTYPKQFQEFINDYKKYKNNDLYYVQFSNHATNTIDKRMYDNPDHSDPMGVYGYPIKYVINYPADIWYGKKAKYLRVLKLKSWSGVLELQNMSLRDMERMTFDMGISDALRSSKFDIETHLNKIKRKLGYKGNKALHKAFMSLVQCVLDGEGMPTDRTISAKEQNTRFRKTGYTVLLDNARNPNTAMINDREPNQIIFLTRDTFDIEVVYQLREKEENNIITGSNDVERLSRKIAGMFFKDIGDSLKDIMGKGRFWSKQGIEMIVSHDDKLMLRMDKMHGTGYSKPHKEHKLHDDAIFSVSIDTKYGTINHTQDSKQTIDSFVHDIVLIYQSMAKNNSIDKDWLPKSKQGVIDKQNREQQDKLTADMAAEEKRYEKTYIESRESMIRITEQLGIDFNIPSREELNTETLRHIINMLDAGRTIDLIKKVVDTHKHKYIDNYTKNIISHILDTIVEISSSGLEFADHIYNKENGRVMLSIVNIVG